MTPSRMRLVVLAALVCGAVVIPLALTNDHKDPKVVWAVFGPAVGWLWVGTGLYAWRRRPESRTGMLMVLFGFAWFLSAVNLSNLPAVATSGFIVGGLWGGVFLQLELAFPSGRLAARTDRVLTIAGYLLFTIGSLPAVLFATPHDLGCDDCPRNVLLVHHDAGLATAMLALEALGYAVLFVIVLVRLAKRWRRTPPLERIQLTPVYACGLLAFLLVTVAQSGGGNGLWWSAFVATAVLPFAFLAGLLRGHVAHLDAELRARLEELRASRARLVEASDTERRRLERNLHDGAQSRFVGLALLLGHARRRVDADPTDPEIPELLDQATEELKAGLAELRELARGIHPPLLTDQGLEPALHALAARAPVPVTLAADVGDRLPAPVEIAAYFVVAEALTNVGKYAQASAATIAVRRVNGLVTVDVADDGVGGADVGRGTGLRGLNDRVAVLDGTLAVDSPSGGGTRLHVEIPCGATATGTATAAATAAPARGAAGRSA
jgi:signal transduction histidine kinase